MKTVLSHQKHGVFTNRQYDCLILDVYGADLQVVMSFSSVIQFCNGVGSGEGLAPIRQWSGQVAFCIRCNANVAMQRNDETLRNVSVSFDSRLHHAVHRISKHRIG